MDKQSLDAWHRLLTPELIGLDIMDGSLLYDLIIWFLKILTKVFTIIVMMYGKLHV